MRTPFMAGNWKMYKTVPEALDFVKAVRDLAADVTTVEMGICAPYVALAPLADALRDSPIKLGAQNMYYEDEGAYTGEVSPRMLRGLVDYVIIGHSERRQYFSETDETVNLKIRKALEYDLLPIVCVGETFEQNQAGETESFVSGQVTAAFDGISAEDANRIVVAYEPIWAIGTGLTATPDEANRIIGEVVRASLKKLYADTAERIRIQYGGSVKPANCLDLMGQPEIDGGLVGGASLKPGSFAELVTLTIEAKGL